MKKNYLMKAVLMIVLLLGSSLSQASFTNIMYQGFIVENSMPVSDRRTLIFKIYSGLDVTNKVWTCQKDNVDVVNGVYSCNLSGGLPNLSSVDWSGDRYIEVWNNGNVIQPRVKLAAVPYAINARKSDESTLSIFSSNALLAQSSIFASNSAKSFKALVSSNSFYSVSSTLTNVISSFLPGTPVYFNGHAFLVSNSEIPIGVVNSVGKIVVNGICDGLENLIPGKEYFLGNTSSLSTNYSKIKIGVAVSSDSLFVNIKVLTPTIQIFTNNGVWIRPSGVQYVKVTVVGPGGDGGNGGSMFGSGGGGGGSGEVMERIVKVDGNISVQVGKSSGETSSFGTIVAKSGISGSHGGMGGAQGMNQAGIGGAGSGSGGGGGGGGIAQNQTPGVGGGIGGKGGDIGSSGQSGANGNTIQVCSGSGQSYYCVNLKIIGGVSSSPYLPVRCLPSYNGGKAGEMQPWAGGGGGGAGFGGNGGSGGPRLFYPNGGGNPQMLYTGEDGLGFGAGAGGGAGGTSTSGYQGGKGSQGVVIVEIIY